MTDKTRNDAISLIQRYYERFNAGDIGRLPLAPHRRRGSRPEPGRTRDRQAGVQALPGAHEPLLPGARARSRCHGRRQRPRAAAEFQLDGKYVATDGDLPPARGQTYVLTVGAFFEIHGGQVARISNTYNFKDWLRQVQG